MNKTFKILKLSLFLLVLGIISGGLLSLVNNFTKDKIAKNELDNYYADIVALGIKSDSIKEMEIDKEEGIDTIYRANTIDDIPCYVFLTHNSNPYTTVNTIILVEIATENILNIKVSPGATTHNLDDKFINNTFGVIGSSIEDAEDNFEIVTRATASSNSVKNCIRLVKNQLSLFEGKAQVKSYVQCLPEYTNFEYTFTKNNQEVTLLLKYNESSKTFEYIDIISGNASEENVAEFIALANITSPTNCIKSIYTDPNGSRLTIVTDKGFKGEIIAEVKVYNNRVIAFELKTSNENYQYNSDYTYEGKVEDYIFEQYSLGIKNQIVTGATVTSKAINYILEIADSYIDSLGGTK